MQSRWLVPFITSGFVDLEFGLAERNGFRCQGLPSACFTYPCDGMLTKTARHMEKNSVRGPRHQTFQRERPVLRTLRILPSPHVGVECVTTFASCQFSMGLPAVCIWVSVHSMNWFLFDLGPLSLMKRYPASLAL